MDEPVTGDILRPWSSMNLASISAQLYRPDAKSIMRSFGTAGSTTINRSAVLDAETIRKKASSWPAEGSCVMSLSSDAGMLAMGCGSDIVFHSLLDSSLLDTSLNNTMTKASDNANCTCMAWLPRNDVLAVGCSDGYLRLFSSTATLILQQRLHDTGALLAVKIYPSATPAAAEAMQRIPIALAKRQLKALAESTDLAFELWCLYEGGVVAALPLHKLRQRLEESGRRGSGGRCLSESPLAMQKFKLEGQQSAVDFCVSSFTVPKLFEVSCPTINHVMAVGLNPSFAVYDIGAEQMNVDLGKIASAVASKMKDAMGTALSSFTKTTGVGSAWGSWASGWTSSSSATSAGQAGETVDLDGSEEAVLIPAEKLFAIVTFPDARRSVTCCDVDPTGRLAAVVDNFGRVMAVELGSMTVMRMWKGYRQAQVAWMHCPERWEGQWDGVEAPSQMSQGSWALYLVIYAAKRGVIEMYRMRHGPRVAAVFVGSEGRLISVTPTVGSPFNQVYFITTTDLTTIPKKETAVDVPILGSKGSAAMYKLESNDMIRGAVLKYFSQGTNQQDSYLMHQITLLLRGGTITVKHSPPPASTSASMPPVVIDLTVEREVTEARVEVKGGKGHALKLLKQIKSTSSILRLTDAMDALGNDWYKTAFNYGAMSPTPSPLESSASIVTPALLLEATRTVLGNLELNASTSALSSTADSVEAISPASRVAAVELSKAATGLLWRFRGRELLLEAYVKLHDASVTLLSNSYVIGEGLPSLQEAETGVEVMAWLKLLQPVDDVCVDLYPTAVSADSESSDLVTDSSLAGREDRSVPGWSVAKVSLPPSWQASHMSPSEFLQCWSSGRRKDFKSRSKKELFARLKRHDKLPRGSRRWLLLGNLLFQPLLTDVFALQTVLAVTSALELKYDIQLEFFLGWFMSLPVLVLLQTTSDIPSSPLLRWLQAYRDGLATMEREGEDDGIEGEVSVDPLRASLKLILSRLRESKQLHALLLCQLLLAAWGGEGSGGEKDADMAAVVTGALTAMLERIRLALFVSTTFKTIIADLVSLSASSIHASCMSVAEIEAAYPIPRLLALSQLDEYPDAVAIAAAQRRAMLRDSRKLASLPAPLPSLEDMPGAGTYSWRQLVDVAADVSLSHSEAVALLLPLHCNPDMVGVHRLWIVAERWCQGLATVELGPVKTGDDKVSLTTVAKVVGLKSIKELSNVASALLPFATAIGDGYTRCMALLSVWDGFLVPVAQFLTHSDIHCDGVIEAASFADFWTGLKKIVAVISDCLPEVKAHDPAGHQEELARLGSVWPAPIDAIVRVMLGDYTEVPVPRMPHALTLQLHGDMCCVYRAVSLLQLPHRDFFCPPRQLFPFSCKLFMTSQHTTATCSLCPVPLPDLDASAFAREMDVCMQWRMKFVVPLLQRDATVATALATELGLNKDSVRQRQVVMLYERGYDVPAEDLISQVEDTAALGLDLLRISRFRLKRVINAMRCSSKYVGALASIDAEVCQWVLDGRDEEEYSDEATRGIMMTTGTQPSLSSTHSLLLIILTKVPRKSEACKQAARLRKLTDELLRAVDTIAM